MGLQSQRIDILDEMFNDVYQPYRVVQTPLQIFFGGSSSGKSVFIAQRIIEDLLEGGRNYLCVRKISRTLRSSVFNELKKAIKEWNVSHWFKLYESDMTITCKSGYSVFLRGLDDVEKLKSIVPTKGVITDIWIEEATEITYDDFKPLTKRLRGKTEKWVRKRITLSFNPIMKNHWIFKTFFKTWTDGQKTFHDEKILILKTTYKDNQFLTQDDVDLLENETDPYYYDVYTLGEWGVLGDLIFKNWRIEDVLSNEKLVETFDKFKHGLDFGYSNDPTAYNKMYYHSGLGKLYIIEEWNDKGITNDQIALALLDKVNSDYIVADSAEPKSIAELNTHGLSSIGARKGKDSIKHGIQWLQKLDIIIDVRCQETINEFQLYHWKKDRYGENLNEPVDKNNHHIDAIRYAMEDEMLVNTEDDVEEFGETESFNVDW